MNSEIQTGCRGIGSAVDQGRTVFRELQIVREGISYTISVAEPQYIEKVQKDNQGKSPLVQIDDNILPLPNVSVVESICSELSRIPFDKLQPYLTQMPEGS